MIRLLAPVSPLLLGVAILLTGQGLQSTLLPVRAGIEGFSTFSIGLMGAAYFLGFTLGCLRGVVLVQRVGYVRTFAAMTAAASAAPLLHGLWLDDWVWWMLRLITGFCFAVLYVVIESWLNEISTNRNRGAVFSAYTLITLTVLAVGQQMLLLYDPRQMALFAIASALVSLAALPVVLSTASTPSHEESKVRVDLRRLYTISPSGTLGCLAPFVLRFQGSHSIGQFKGFFEPGKPLRRTAIPLRSIAAGELGRRRGCISEHCGLPSPIA